MSINDGIRLCAEKNALPKARPSKAPMPVACKLIFRKRFITNAALADNRKSPDVKNQCADVRNDSLLRIVHDK